MDKIEKLILVIVCIFILIIVWNIPSCDNKNLKQDNKLLLDLQDTLVKHRNKDGSQTAQIGILQSRNTNLILQLNTKDETIKSLQDEIKKNKDRIKNGGSISVFTTITTYQDSTKTSTSYLSDSSIVYKASSKDTTWVKWNTISNKNSTSLDLKVKNAYTVVIGSERVSLFKRKSIVEVTNKNPFTDTQALRAFEVKDTRRNKLSLGIQGGYGITLKGFGPYLGIGINFKIL